VPPRFPLRHDLSEETPEVPTYGYRCEVCGHEFDVLQRMSDDPVASCPTCGKPARRLFFPAGIVFKGSGFYKTDSRKSGEDTSSSSSPSSSGSSASSGASSTPTTAGTAGE
jgi:putative FmdB family regulatory protein